jgi:ABC-type multidrug transport system ATPase subunit/ABC-type polysaccharide/polyol phosphate export permease
LDWAIQTQALTKNFPANTGWHQLIQRSKDLLPAVRQVDLAVRKGEVFGLLGPNGAGKTTLIKMLSTLILPSSGSATVNGFSLQQESQLKRTIGLATSDERSFYWRLSGRQNLDFFASLFGLRGELKQERINLALEQVNLQEFAERRFQTYSTGMRQRMSIARALLNRPQLLFLDEPTKGLDPIAASQLHDLIRTELHERLGVTIFLTTHNLVEAQLLCDRIAIMDRGRILATGQLSELRQQLNLNDHYLFVIKELQPKQAAALNSVLPAARIDWKEDQQQAVIYVADDGSTQAFDQAYDWLRRRKIAIQAIQQQPASLDQVFSQLLRDGQAAPDPAAVLQPAKIDSKGSPAHPGIHSGNTPKDLTTADPQRSGSRFLPVLMAFIKRDFQNEFSYRFAFFFQFVNIFFMVGVFYFISNLLGPAASPYLASYNGDYFSFVLIGIAFAGYFGVGLSSFSNNIRQAQTTGTLEAMLSTPTSLPAIILSSALWDYWMTTFRVFIYLGVGVLFLKVDLKQANLTSAILILLLTIIVFSSLGVIAASFIMVLKRGDPIAWIFNAASSFLGGVYYPVAILPQWLQFLAWLLPITYALEALRRALLNGATIVQLSPQLAVLCAFCLVLLPISLIAFRQAVRRAKIDGSLSHY